MSESRTTPAGRPVVILGDGNLASGERWDRIAELMDSDPRIASVSVIPGLGERVVGAVAPAGAVIVCAGDFAALAGIPTDTPSLEAWATTCRHRGLRHLHLTDAGDDVHRAPLTSIGHPLDRREADDPTSSRSGGDARMTGPLSIVVDGSWLGPHQTGAQVLTVEAIRALLRNPDVARVSLIECDRLPDYADDLDHHKRFGRAADRSDVFWYPNQLDHRSAIDAARRWGRRVITTYLDLIAYDIDAYHASLESWTEYRSLQRRVALASDGITTISSDVASRLLAEIPTLDPVRVRPLLLGLDHIRVPASTARLEGRAYMLVLGNDFLHKNRDLAIRVWEEVLQQGISIDLVLAGLHVHGSSSQRFEKPLLDKHVDLRGSVRVLGHVTEGERTVLLRDAAVVLYPTSAEGFGFIPYEAATLGTPTSFVGFGPLSEISGLSGLPRSWSVQELAGDVVDLLTDPHARDARVSHLTRVIDRLSWDRFARGFVEFAREVSALPVVPGALLGFPSSVAGGPAWGHRARHLVHRARRRLRG